MLTVVDVKRKLKSVRNIQQITRAMMLVSAAKMRKAEEAILSARPYAKTMEEMLSRIALRVEKDIHPLLTPREKVNQELVVLVTSQRGLCGGFNANITKNTLNFLTQSSISVVLMTIGQKGFQYFKNMQWKIISTWNMPDRINAELCEKIGKEIIDLYLSGEVDKVYVSYNEFKSVFQQYPIIKQLIPVKPADVLTKKLISDYIYEPSPDILLERLLAQYITIQIQRIMLESSAAEHSARMVAMESATKNAEEMIDTLVLNYNRARQASITKEISEIVGTAEALK
jgi:F-type H+-transporting ATPase subunit gamma